MQLLHAIFKMTIGAVWSGVQYALNTPTFSGTEQKLNLLSTLSHIIIIIIITYLISNKITKVFQLFPNFKNIVLTFKHRKMQYLSCLVLHIKTFTSKRNKSQPTKIFLLLRSINITDNKTIVILCMLYTITPVYIEPYWLYRSHRPGILSLTITVLRSVVDFPTPKHFG